MRPPVPIDSLRGLPLLLCLSCGCALAAAAPPRVSIQPVKARPGDPVLVTVRGLEQAPTGTLGERVLHFYPTPGGFQALTGLPVEQPLGTLPVVVVPGETEGGGTPWTETLRVVAPGWPTRTLKVAGKFIKPPPEVEERMKEDQAAFTAAFAQPFSPPLFTGSFAWPRPEHITAPFGDLRTFNGKKQSQHYGTDLKGATGDPIRAAHAGTVVMRRENYAAGNTVLLYHGAGLYTAYFHLSAFEVKEGDSVKQGQLLGKVGGTGRVTGPHLHWGVKVDDLWVDAQTLLKLDFTPSPAAPGPAK